MDTAKNHDPASSTSPAIPPLSPESPVAPVRRPGDTALTIIAALAFVFALQWARDFFIPLVFGILIAYTLNPVVIWLERLRMPRALASSVVMLALLGSSILVVSSVYNEAQAIMDELPVATYKLTNALRKLDNGEQGPLDKLRNAADTLKKAASSDNDADNKLETSVSAPPAVLIKQPDFDLNDWLLAGSKSAAAFIGQLTMVLFLVFFALVSGNTFKRKLVKLTGPSLTNKKITVQILDDINTSIQKYMLMLLITNTLLGLLTWLALHWIGLDNAGAWALVAALTHIIPYFGSMIAMALIAFAAFLQFESFSMMLLAAFATLAISTFVGMLVSTWMTGRIAKMNAVAVFVALLFGAWLWGVWGMLLCVPVIVVIKVVSQHVEDLHAIAELLSE